MRRRTKYRNKISVKNGVRYLSQLERDRHEQLLALEKTGVIHSLQWQVSFPFEINGVRVCRYIADATYFIGDEFIVEEVKGRWTDVAKLKKKLFEVLYQPQRLTVITRNEVYGSGARGARKSIIARSVSKARG